MNDPVRRRTGRVSAFQAERHQATNGFGAGCVGSAFLDPRVELVEVVRPKPHHDRSPFADGGTPLFFDIRND